MNISNDNNTTRESGTDSTISPSTSTSDNYKESASKSNNDDSVCDVNNKLQNMSMADEGNDILLVCANCGKKGSDVNNICNKCKQVKYCNAACKKKHRHKHKKQCEEYVRLAAERAAELHDEELFKEPPNPYEDCPICFLRLPTLDTGRKYYTCCGKVICSGCIHAPVYDNQGNKVDNEKCPFCRVEAPISDEEANKRIIRLVDKNDAEACYNLGIYYARGLNGFSQDYGMALELWHRAAKLGNTLAMAMAYCCIGTSYNNGQGVEVDMKEAGHYYELAAIGGERNCKIQFRCT